METATDNCSGVVATDEWFNYGARGALTDVYESTPHSGGYYHTTASYWPDFSLETLSGIPSAPTIYYGASNGAGLDGEGRVTQVTASSGPNPVTGVTYSTSSTTNPLGALTGVTFGSADSDSFSYYPNTGRMASYSFNINGQTDTGTLTWNTNGTLSQLAIVDQISGTSDSQTCNYLYDDLQRVSSSSCGTPWAQTFTYDPFGNIAKSGTLSFIPGYSATQNQFTSIPGVTVAYDGNGNLLTDNLNTYTWDVYGHMSTVNTGSTTVTATYDALDRVVEQYNGSAYTEILYSPLGKTALMNGSTLIKAFVNLPGGATAVYNSSGLAYYRHSDHLGSSRLASTQARGLYSSTAYAPFGEPYATAGTADASFTGQNQDTVPSLYDFTFRKHSPSQGRWISPDPLGVGAVDPTNPQMWNRYAYVANSPLSYIDPLGLNRQFPGGGCDSDHMDCGSSGGSPSDPGSGGASCFYASCGIGSGFGENSGMPSDYPEGVVGWNYDCGYLGYAIYGTCGGGNGEAGSQNVGSDAANNGVANTIRQLQNCNNPSAQSAGNDLARMQANGQIQITPSSSPYAGNTTSPPGAMLGLQTPIIQINSDYAGEPTTLIHEWVHKTQQYGNPLGFMAVGFNKIWASFTSDGEGPLDTSAQAVAQKMVSVCNIQ